MVDTAKRHLRLAKIKFRTRVSTFKYYFYVSAPISEQFYGSVMKVLDNVLVGVKWEVDNTIFGRPK